MARETLIKTDRNGTKYWQDCTCQRCGGHGIIPGYQYIEGGVCFECGGSGISRPHVRKEYTTEYAAKLEDARRKREDKRKAEALAEFEKNREEELLNLGFKNGNTYCVMGDTYAIREELKKAGAKFCRELGWHFAEQNPAYPCIRISAADVISDNPTWSYGKPHLAFREDTQEIVKRMTALPKKPSEYVGEVGKRITLDLTVKKTREYDLDYGWYGTTMFVNIMEDPDGNTVVWKTSSWLGQEGQTYTITGTVKDHSEYNEVKQTVLTRCKVKED